MRITRLQLTNFRNYAEQTLEPDTGTNLFVGPNGQGKSAILEATYLLATSKSHRTTRDVDLIKIDSEWARIAGEADREEREEVLLEITLARKEKKTVRINKVRHDKIGDIVGQLNAVIFSSTDIDMVKGDPSHRRRFLNLEVSQVSPQYVYALGRYKRVLEQRNATLKDARIRGISSNELDIWDEQLSTYGSVLIEKRLAFLGRLSEIAEPIYLKLSGGKETLDIEYEPSVGLKEEKSAEEIKRTFSGEMAESREHDLHRGTTTRGPHRDDIVFKVNGMDVRAFGSQGQQRSAALSVKLAEIELIEEMVGETPVALLDDVASELDEQRREQVFDLTSSRCQLLVTATSVSEIPSRVVSNSSVFNVSAGTVKRA
jgi:DNA replication and repair protein RecF